MVHPLSNKEDAETRKLIALALVALLVVIAGYVWFVDFVSEQQVFGFLLSAEFIAFSMLVYVYTKAELDQANRSWLLIGCLGLALCLFAAFMVG